MKEMEERNGVGRDGMEILPVGAGRANGKNKREFQKWAKLGVVIGQTMMNQATASQENQGSGYESPRQP